MTLLAPRHLWFLLGIGALAAMYLALLVRRRSYAGRFASPQTLSSVLPRRPGWRRNVAVSVMLAAMAVAVVGLARPARAERVARKEATVMLAIDVSASMEATDVAPSRIVAAKAAAADFVRQLPAEFKVGVVTFSGTARVLSAPTADRAIVTDILANLQTDRGTAAGDGIVAALNAIGAQRSAPDASATVEGAPARIVLLSDGLTTVGTAGAPIADAVEAAKAQSVPITTISFGTPSGTIEFDGATLPVPANGALLAQIAQDTGGSTFEAASSDELRSVYQDVGRRITYTLEQRELTMLFIAIALGLAFVGLASTIAVTGRIA